MTINAFAPPSDEQNAKIFEIGFDLKRNS